MYLAISKRSIEWLIISYSTTVQPSEGISEAYSHLGAHNKLLMCQHAAVAASSPSSSEIHVSNMCFLYPWHLETDTRGKKYNTKM